MSSSSLFKVVITSVEQLVYHFLEVLVEYPFHLLQMSSFQSHFKHSFQPFLSVLNNIKIFISSVLSSLKPTNQISLLDLRTSMKREFYVLIKTSSPCSFDPDTTMFSIICIPLWSIHTTPFTALVTIFS